MKKFYIILIALCVVQGTMAQWFQQNSGNTRNLNSVFFLDNITGYIVGDSGTIIKTTDGGNNWIMQNSGTTESLYKVYFLNADTGYITHYSETIFYTNDGGTTWSLQTIDTNFRVNSVFFTNPNTGYMVGCSDEIWYEAYGIIMKTTDGGNNWVLNYTYPHVHLDEVYFIDDSLGYFAGSWFGADPAGLILKTIDGGNVWQETIIGVFSGISSLSMPSADTGFVVCASDLIFTTNGWESYTITSNNLGWFTRIFYTCSDIGYGLMQSAFGLGGMIVKTTNCGTTWDIQVSNLLNGPNSIFFPAEDTGYVVGYDGLILKTTNGGFTDVNEIDVYKNTLIIIPNPANDKIIIKTLKITGIAELEIFNIDGVKVIEQQIRNTETQLDISALPRGVYVVRVRDEEMIEMEKIIKQ